MTTVLVFPCIKHTWTNAVPPQSPNWHLLTSSSNANRSQGPTSKFSGDMVWLFQYSSNVISSSIKAKPCSVSTSMGVAHWTEKREPVWAYLQNAHFLLQSPGQVIRTVEAWVMTFVGSSSVVPNLWDSRNHSLILSTVWVDQLECVSNQWLTLLSTQLTPIASPEASLPVLPCDLPCVSNSLKPPSCEHSMWSFPFFFLIEELTFEDVNVSLAYL